MIELVHRLPEQIKEAVNLGNYIKLTPAISSIVFAGMGGSGIPGSILESILPELKTTVVHDYHLPKWIDKNTLVVCFSYSGNTEETISCFKEALKKKLQTLIVTTGGRLKLIADQAESNNKIIIPRGLPPRQAVGYFVFSVLTVLQNNNLAKISRNEVNDVIISLKKPGFDEQAEKLIEQIKGKIPLIYTTLNYESVALRWKQCFNENSKSFAFYSLIPELDHNELMAYAKTRKEFHVIFLRDESESKQINKHFELTKEIVKSAGNSVTEIKLKGTSPLIKIFNAVYLGDLTSVYLAKEYSFDPLETKLIESFKKRLSQ